VETITKTDGVATKDYMKRTAARNVDASAVRHGDAVVVRVGDVVLEESLDWTHVTGSPAVDTCVCSRGLERA
jgi:hypothetical protein